VTTHRSLFLYRLSASIISYCGWWGLRRQHSSSPPSGDPFRADYHETFCFRGEIVEVVCGDIWGAKLEVEAVENRGSSADKRGGSRMKIARVLSGEWGAGGQKRRLLEGKGASVTSGKRCAQTYLGGDYVLVFSAMLSVCLHSVSSCVAVCCVFSYLWPPGLRELMHVWYKRVDTPSCPLVYRHINTAYDLLL
jgi:hypothetical protein